MSNRDVIGAILGFATLILFWFLGYGLGHFIALPAALLGLISLFIMLLVLRRVPKNLAMAAQFSLRHLSFFFIPLLAASWFYAEQLEQNLWLFLAAILVSTFVSFWITTWIAQILLTQPDDSVERDIQE